MDKQTIIERIRHCITTTPCDGCPYGEMGSMECFIGLMRDTLEMIEGEQQEEDRWIPVTENTLPDKGKVVIALGKKGTWDFGTYRGYFNDIHYWKWKKNTLKKVYWWMYKDGALPEPYQEEEE